MRRKAAICLSLLQLFVHSKIELATTYVCNSQKVPSWDVYGSFVPVPAKTAEPSFTPVNAAPYRRFWCKTCRKIFPSKYLLKRHMKLGCKMEPRASQYACNLCPYKSTYKANMDRHVRNVHESAAALRYRCDLCGFYSNYRFCVRRHLKSVHRITGPEEKQLKAQKKKDTESEPEFINEESLEEVYEEVYEEEMITYEVVEEIEVEDAVEGEKSYDMEEIVEEEIVEEAEKKNEEEMIVEKKEKKVAVKKEATKKKNKKKYKRRSKMCQCEYCGNIYAWSTSLARHLRECRKRKDNKMVNDEPKENVEIKDEESVKKPVVKSVKILRSGAPEKKSSKQYEHEMKKYKSADGMYTCWGCGRKYHWASSLSRHRTIHCGPRNKMKYVCKLCSYKSGYRGNFLRHLKTPRHKRNARFKKMQKIMEEAIRNEDEEEEEFEEEYDI
ncbi:Protein of unknown function [Cotesia congregata]|uniref:C2H2-type domain-containing protein n=1 Tax=Cotesia congregata TaxID=51543 RepID=A0A8J2MNY4_COTCN|nr:Protein of unknown function [Cotesia congregata]